MRSRSRSPRRRSSRYDEGEGNLHSRRGAPREDDDYYRSDRLLQEGRDPPPHQSRYRERGQDREQDKHLNRDRDSRRGVRPDRDMDIGRGAERPRYGRGDDRDIERDRGENRPRERNYDRDRDADRRYDRPPRRSASPPHARRARSDSHSRSADEDVKKDEDKAKPNYAPSGLLAAATNTVKAADGTSTVLKYNEPPEARKPILGWRLYVFKGPDQVELLHIHRQSAYLIGRDRMVADIPIDHPSCSKQHAVIQYRSVHERNEYGETKSVIKPFIIDLESTNGTHVNDEAIPVSRYYELKPSDVIKFGLSTREYVILHDDAA